MNQDGPRPDRTPLSASVGQQIEVDHVSDEFERAWRSGQRPRIEAFLERVPVASRERLLEELLVTEFQLLWERNEAPDVAAYRRRFSGRDAVIDAAIEAALAVSGDRSSGELPLTTATAAVDFEKCLDEEAVAPPQRIGRFAIRRQLGSGGFGVVYLAHDSELDRLVALKVPRRELWQSGQQRDDFLHEARTAARLKHAGLVAVHDVQHQEDGLIYIVQEYVEGPNLAEWAAAAPRSWEEITGCLIEIGTAIGHVHQQGVYHRDLKPSNILIDREGHSHVTDFGLAVHEDGVRMLKGQAAGTPQYMSPEQVRGETHWIDGRTDIWALGVILYELLAGKRPFSGSNRLELLEEIQERDPTSPRAKNSAVPRELERICFKCLAKRRSDRYTNVPDLLEDLRAFLDTCAKPTIPSPGPVQGLAQEPGDGVAGAGSTIGLEAESMKESSKGMRDSGSQLPLKIVPKGLRSFDKEDKDFFLELLPGPRDREGLPDSIRFWKTRIEEENSDATFPVGVMYGPSGCGKSSLVKAGLLPRLAAQVLPIYIEATPHDTELRLHRALRKQVPGLTQDAPLVETLALLRENRVAEGRKVVLVLDQFEQWLHGAASLSGSELVRGLRQCDGANLQCLILVRDDFWMSTTRFMQAMEILQIEGTNSAAVDLFDPTHARKVLRAYGLAYGRLPEHDLAADEQRFLDRAVQDLTHNGKVICVQLSLLADMMKGRPWTPVSLHEVGGTSGVGVTFLDETFTAKTAPPTHRIHAKAAQAVLKALLPEVGTDIKGQMQPAAQLMNCSGYAARPDDFRHLLQILNSELRLITPTESEEADTGGAEPMSETADRKYYQLTHDYLVPSLRDWLTRKQRASRRGRAQLRLEERSAMWAAKPENQQLPSWFEDLSIRCLTQRRKWTDAQRRMMGRSGRLHVLRWGVRLSAIAAMTIGVWLAVWFTLSRSLEDRLKTSVTTVGRSRGRDVLQAISDLKEYPPERVSAALTGALEGTANNSEKLPFTFAMAEFGQVNCTGLIEAIGTAPNEEVDNLVVALSKDRESAVTGLRKAAVDATSRQDWKLKTRLATVALYLNDTSIAAEMLQAEPPAAKPRAAKETKPDWHDGPLDPNWRPVSDVTKVEVEAAHGLIEERSAYCIDMPWNSFLTLIETLRPSGYRPTRVRPFVVDGQRRVAAVWTRDARPFNLQHDQAAEQLPPFSMPIARDTLVPVDVAGYPGDDGTVVYCVLLSTPESADETRRMLGGLTKDEWTEANTWSTQGGLHPQVLHATVGADGTRCFAGIWSSQGKEKTAVIELPKDEVIQANSGRWSWEDLSVAVAGRQPHPLEQQRLIPLWLGSDPRVTPEDRLARGKARYYLDQPSEALVDLDALVVQDPSHAEALLYGALCHAQLGQAEEAKAAMEKMPHTAQTSRWSCYGSVLLCAWLGQLDEAKRALDELINQGADSESSNDSMTLYNAARVAAQCSRILKNSSPDEVAAWKQRSLELLRQFYAHAHCTKLRIECDPDFAPLYDDPTFQLTLPQAYAGVVRSDNQFESSTDIGQPWSEFPQAARTRIMEGWRPLAVAVASVPNQSQPPVTVAWRRPRLAPPPIRLWDPTQRTMFIEHFPTWSGSAEKLVDVLRKEDNASLRSGISLALGSVANPNGAAKHAWKPVLGDWYRSQPDKGVHGATKWALQSWNLTLPNLDVETSPSTACQWRVTKKGLTMLRIPAGETQTPEDAEVREESRTIRIADEFWLSDCEVTAGLFGEFLRDPEAEKPPGSEEYHDPGSNADNLNLPVISVSWYDAVLFCNWLSHQEGLLPCYEKEGKETIRDYDDKTREFDAWKLIEGANGYRLPTEDQWEYACRVWTTTVFACGDDEKLLDRYSVYGSIRRDRPTAVGEKLCNAWGLFDMHGNVHEWCQDGYIGSTYRGSRGGSWIDSSASCRPALRRRGEPNKRFDPSQGFRVATVPFSQ